MNLKTTCEMFLNLNLKKNYSKILVPRDRRTFPAKRVFGEKWYRYRAALRINESTLGIIKNKINKK